VHLELGLLLDSIGILSMMCRFASRVFICGHYRKVLWDPCDEAKRQKRVCDEAKSEDSSASTWCGVTGCDRKAGPIREGPGELIDSFLSDSHSY
jgi:hypothetical protein